MKIRRATIKDIPKISKLANKTFDQFVIKSFTKKAAEYLRKDVLSEEGIKNRLIKGEYKFYVAEESNKIVGFIEFILTDLKLFFVDSKQQGKGIGRKLLNKYESILKKNGYNFIHVNASVHSCPIYQKLGFKMTTGMRQSGGIKYQPMKKILN